MNLEHAAAVAFFGIIIHLVVDWLFQNRWMADNKANPKHIAGYVHAGLHAIALLLVFPWPAALAIGFIHWLIDLRFILVWWRKVYQQGPMDQPIGLHIAIWGDQVVHFAVVALAALVVCR